MGGTPQYWQKIKSMFGSHLIAYYPMWEQSGTVVYDLSPNVLNGVNDGATVGQTGIGDRKTSYLFDAINDKVNIHSASLAALFNGAAGGISLWCKPATGILEDSTFRRLIELIVDAQNKVLITRSNTNGQIYLQYLAGNTAEYLYLYGLNHTGWMNITATWSKADDRVRLYFNGKKYRVDAGTLGTFVGSLTGAGIGFTPGGTSCWGGNIAHVLLTNREITETEAQKISDIGTLKTYITLGDSITANANNWIEHVVGNYPGGNRSCLINHAVAGHSIVTNMDAQTVASANNNADVIIIALGTNDNNAGNMTALQAEYEENVAELKLSNPRATIYALNVLPCWTDVGGGTEVDKSNIRTAIASACTAQGITCWDTYSTPWIDAADTSDGVHPTTTGGHAKIAAKVLERLP